MEGEEKLHLSFLPGGEGEKKGRESIFITEGKGGWGEVAKSGSRPFFFSSEKGKKKKKKGNSVYL